MSTYMGPWAVGMLVTTGRGGCPSDFRLTQAHVDAWTRSDPGGWRPVRPADDDAAAWALFVPDAPLPNTGPKEFKVGQVWALGHAAYRCVFRVDAVLKECDQWLHVTTLAGNQITALSNREFTDRTVLLFDAPESTAKPADRPLAPGWMAMAQLSHRCKACRKFPGNCKYVLDNYTYCETCADAAGCFADAPKAEPRQDSATVKRAVDALAALVPKALPRCGKCSHAGHSGPCGGSSPNGLFGCPCGDLTAKDAKLAASGAYAVGTYSDTDTSARSLLVKATTDSFERCTGGDRRAVLLTNLARERPPDRVLPKVSACYAPDGPGCDRDNLPNREVG